MVQVTVREQQIYIQDRRGIRRVTVEIQQIYNSDRKKISTLRLPKTFMV